MHYSELAPIESLKSAAELGEKDDEPKVYEPILVGHQVQKCVHFLSLASI